METTSSGAVIVDHGGRIRPAGVTYTCPHCGAPLGDRHVCADRDPWTPGERDAWRALVRERFPAVQFVDSGYASRVAAMARGRSQKTHDLPQAEQ